MANDRTPTKKAQNTLWHPSLIKVFISYTQESVRHSRQVLALTNQLRQSGFNCDIDQYHANQDWPTWMEKSIAKAHYVLIVCTPVYLRRWNHEEKAKVGLGAQWESLLARQLLYVAAGRNHKFVPGVFKKDHLLSIPIPLTGVTRIDLFRKSGFVSLQRRLLNIPPAVKPPVATSLAPIPVAKGFFGEQVVENPVRPTPNQVVAFDLTPYGLVNQAEALLPNLFRVSFPPAIKTARITVKRTVKFGERLRHLWEELGQPDRLPVDYWIEGSVLYRFKPFTGTLWEAMVKRRFVQPLVDKSASDWSASPKLEDKRRFIKLLNRALDDFCLSLGTAHDLVWSKDMGCHLFVPRRDAREGFIKVKALTQEAPRFVFKAIPDKTAADGKKVQHWQHQAFRHSFVRYGRDRYLNVIPFWAFTSDSKGYPSRWQRSSSANMRRPEKNRAVLGHVMFWASILCQEPDFFRTADAFQIHRPVELMVDPAVDDSAWIRVAKAEDKQALNQDLNRVPRLDSGRLARQPHLPARIPDGGQRSAQGAAGGPGGAGEIVPRVPPNHRILTPFTHFARSGVL